MIRSLFARPGGFTGFRLRLLLAMMLVIVALTAIAVYLVQRIAMADVDVVLQQDFRSELSSLDRAEELRRESLTERCRSLVLNPRLHAALEDNALDLLYPSARDELRDLVQKDDQDANESGLRATFYRFLNLAASIIPPSDFTNVGELGQFESSQLVLRTLPTSPQNGYFLRSSSQGNTTLEEVIAVPVFSTETGEAISALIVGFKLSEPTTKGENSGIRRGIWVNDRLYLPGSDSATAEDLNRKISGALNGKASRSLPLEVGGQSYLLFYRLLNPVSSFPPAYQVCIYPLRNALARQRTLQWRIIGAGCSLLAFGFIASHFAARTLARPVEQLALESQTNLAERQRVEANLANTNQELKRSARFSANASHQLKNPVTVLRAGIESLLTREDFESPVYEELSSLLHQTYRLTGVIDDLLLLSRMDAGHLQIDFGSVNLSEVVNEWLDDFSALPNPMGLRMEKQLPPSLRIAGEKRYTRLIVQNLLENARKYNRPGGRIRIRVEEVNDNLLLIVGNTGAIIAVAEQQHLFERFYRGGASEKVTGHGLGLNLARDLALLHRGELFLIRSENDWTEFAVRFQLAGPGNNGTQIT
ncbi:MAG: HAMP domain-containing sensor histidine kinase [Verrucomicrobiota bacterium]